MMQNPSPSWPVAMVTAVALLLIGMFVWMAYQAIGSGGDSFSSPEIRVLSSGVIAVIGVMVLFGVFLKMQGGIGGTANTRAIGFAFVAVLVSLLSTLEVRESAFGLLGTIVGYLFGKDTSGGGNTTS